MILAMYRALVVRPGVIFFKTDDSVSVFNSVSLQDSLGMKKEDITYWASQTTARLFNINYIEIADQIERLSNNFDERIDLQDVAGGIYILSVKRGNKVSSHKIRIK